MADQRSPDPASAAIVPTRGRSPRRRTGAAEPAAASDAEQLAALVEGVARLQATVDAMSDELHLLTRRIDDLAGQAGKPARPRKTTAPRKSAT